MVRRHCADGKLIAQQTLEGSGKWRIETDQLMDKPNWDKFIEKRARINSKWENDKSVPDIMNLVQLSEVYDVSLDYLIKADYAERSQKK